jgi:hypothetical protein
MVTFKELQMQELLSFIDFTSSIEIEALEKELQKKKRKQDEINTKYKLLIKMVTKIIENDNLNFTFVMALLQKAIEEKK